MEPGHAPRPLHRGRHHPYRLHMARHLRGQAVDRRERRGSRLRHLRAGCLVAFRQPRHPALAVPLGAQRAASIRLRFHRDRRNPLRLRARDLWLSESQGPQRNPPRLLWREPRGGFRPRALRDPRCPLLSCLLRLYRNKQSLPLCLYRKGGRLHLYRRADGLRIFPTRPLALWLLPLLR